MRQLKVLLADNHRAFSEAVAVRLGTEPDIQVVGITTFERIAEVPADLSKADVLVTEVEVGGHDALDVAFASPPGDRPLRVIVLTSSEEPEVALQLLRRGAAGFLTKDVTVDDLLGAIRGAARKETWVSPRVLTAILRELLAGPRQLTSWERGIVELTPREREVLECMVAGMSRNAIAKALFLSPNTVRTHTRRVLAKLDVHSSLEAVAVALRAGVKAWRPD